MEKKELAIKNIEKIGIENFYVLKYFQSNVINTLRTIELYWNTFLDSDIFNNKQYSNEDVILFKQQIVSDIIVKSEILIESSLILFHELSSGYSNLSKRLMYYNTDSARDTIKEMIKDNYNLNNSFGIPSFTQLDLTNEERHFLTADYKNLMETIKINLKDIINFYENFKFLYGKMKHGLTYVPMIFHSDSDDKMRSFNNSMLYCLGRIEDVNNVPKEWFHISIINSDPPMKNRLVFNSYSCIRFGDKLLDYIKKTLSQLQDCLLLICNNHVLKILNGSNGFLLFKEENNIRNLVTSKEYQDEKNIHIIKSIAQKNLENQISPNIISAWNFKFINEEVNKSLLDNIITNIYLQIK